MEAKLKLTAAFKEVMTEFDDSPAIRFIREGKLTLPQYKSILREIFHYSRENPQIQSLATSYFRGRDRDAVKTMLKHAVSEIGHDQLALDDLKACGEDVSEVPLQYPLRATTAMTAFSVYQITTRNAVGYLGWLYFLEHMPTTQGAVYAAALSQAGVPEHAMRFLREHISVDEAHVKLMDRYVDRLVRTQADLDEVVYAMRVTGKLYADMLWEAISSSRSPGLYGLDPQEVARH